MNLLDRLPRNRITETLPLLRVARPPAPARPWAGAAGSAPDDVRAFHRARDCGRAAGAGRPGPGQERVLVEKPFGRDLASARELAGELYQHLDESQGFRIDHARAGVESQLPGRRADHHVPGQARARRDPLPPLRQRHVRTHFTRQDNVEECWRIVQPLLDSPGPVHPYSPGSWGPEPADELLAGHGGWHEPWLAGEAS